MEKNNHISFLNSLDFKLLISQSKKSVFWIILIFILAFVGSKIYLKYTPQKFSTSMIIKINDKSTPGNLLISNSSGEEDKLREIEVIIKSPFLIAQAIKNMNYNIGYFNKGDILTNTQYKSAPYRINISNEKLIYNDFGPFLINFDIENLCFSIKKNGKEIIKNGKENKTYNTEFGDFKITNINFQALNSYDQEDDQLYFAKINQLNLARQLTNSIGAYTLDGTAKTIKLEVSGTNGKFNYDLLNSLYKTYIRYDINEKSKSANKIISFIENQLIIVTKDLENYERKLHNFKKNNKIKDIDGYSSSHVERIIQTENELIKIKLNRDILEQIRLDISENENKSFEILSSISGTELEQMLTSQVQQLNNLLITREQMLFSNKENNDNIKNIDNQIRIKQNLLISSLSSIEDRYDEKIQILSSKIEEMNFEFYGIPEKEMQYANLSRMVNIKEKYYLLLLDKKAEYTISATSFVSENQILNPPIIPVSPISPISKNIYINGILIALLLSITLIFVRFLLHNQVYSKEDVLRLLNPKIQFLANIPISPKLKNEKSKLLIDSSKNTIISESFRALRTNLNFIKPLEDKSVISTTSSISGEGKTFISLNLGGTLSLNKKVVLLDLDLRKPKVHIGIDVKNTKGMSNILSSNKTEYKECLNDTYITNFKVITAGPTPPNPSELILNGKLEILIDKLKEEFDYIIIDTPPIGIVTDGIHIMSKADFPIFVLRADYSRKSFINDINNYNETSRIKNLSVVLNAVNIKRTSYGNGYGKYGNSYYNEL